MRTLLITVALVVAAHAATEVSFEPDRGLVMVDVTIDGRVDGRFGLDTGADHLYVDRRFAEESGLSVSDSRPRQVVGILGRATAGSASLRSLQLGNERLYNLSATVIDLRELINDPWAEVPDGLIGHDVLRQFYVTVDYPERRLSLQMGTPSFLSAKASYDAVPFRTVGHLVVVDVLIDQRRTAALAIDYCAAHSFVTSEFAQQLGLSDESGDRIAIDSLGLGPNHFVPAVRAIVDDLEDIRRQAGSRRLAGILGANFLQSLTVTVDYRRQRLYLHE